jgi:hypothetical protein
MAVFVTAPQKFQLLIGKNFWESWSVLTGRGGKVSHYLGRQLGMCRPVNTANISVQL